MCPMEDGVAASAREDTPWSSSSSLAAPLPLFVRRRLQLRREQRESVEATSSLPPLRHSTGRLLDLAATESGFLPLVPAVDDECPDGGNGRGIEKRIANKVGWPAKRYSPDQIALGVLRPSRAKRIRSHYRLMACSIFFRQYYIGARLV